MLKTSFILYTSGSTGKPKEFCILGGYLVYASMTHEYVFNHKEDDIYWCTADVGWITGFLHCVRPLANAATTLIYEGCLITLMLQDFGKFVINIM